jgi:hypothetical protein
MQLSLAQLRITSRERTILVLVVVLLLAGGVFYYLTGRARAAQDALASEMRSMRASLARAATDEDLAQLVVQKEQLEAAFGEGATPGGTDVSEIPVQIASWALQSNVNVLGLTYNPSSTGGASATPEPSSGLPQPPAAGGRGAALVNVHTYAVRLQGSVNDLHRFLVLVADSPIRPHVKDVSLTQEGTDLWDLRASLILTTLERS